MLSSVNNLIEQLRDIWTGRSTYDNDKEWLDNIGHMIGELCEATGNETAGFPDE